MVKHYFFAQIILLIMTSSCSQKVAPKYVKEVFTYCYDGKNTGIESLLDIDGYYVIAEPFDNSGDNSKIDTSYFNIMFYGNGVCVLNFFPLDNKGRFIDNKYMPLFFQTIIKERESKTSSIFYNFFKWGRYIIEGDTIKAQCIYRPRAGETTSIWGINEVWYKIINSTTIIEIPSESLTNTTTSDLMYHMFKNKERISLSARFVPLTVKPTPDCWLMKEDWFWCKNRK
jgi:hypothetical protein